MKLLHFGFIFLLFPSARAENTLCGDLNYRWDKLSCFITVDNQGTFPTGKIEIAAEGNSSQKKILGPFQFSFITNTECDENLDNGRKNLSVEISYIKKGERAAIKSYQKIEGVFNVTSPELSFGLTIKDGSPRTKLGTFVLCDLLTNENLSSTRSSGRK